MLYWQSIDLILLVISSFFVIGLAGIIAIDNFTFVARLLFPFGGLACMMLALTVVWHLDAPPQEMVLPFGLPQLPFHLRLDALSSFFLLVIGVVGTGISLFATGYFRRGEGTPPGLLCLEYHVFLASMVLVILADDAYAFMVSWETMAISSFFLVTANHRIKAIREAGFLYLVIAHVGAIAILLCFGVLQANIGDYTFANMRSQSLTPFHASAAFILALLGFGAKAGMLPLHVWLPNAHPAAPSPVSALMSGVMLKTAIYGLLRITFDLLHLNLWWWGTLLLALGLVTALFGVVFATVQSDMKRLLAYSSIENIGLLLAGIGLAILFRTYNMMMQAALALTAVFYHVAAHALFKSLLFIGTGSVLHATGERNLGHLGGLIRFMPWTSWLTLLGVLASSGLPPLSGFVSEWLLLQTFLFTPDLPDPFLNMFIPIVTAAIALVSALAGYAMVKFFGIVFLGKPREEKLSHARDASPWERAGMLWLAGWTLVLGLFPNLLIKVIDPVTRKLVGEGFGLRTQSSHGWWLLVPTSIEKASYGPVIFLTGVIAISLLVFLLVRLFYHGRLRWTAAWDCGFPSQTARMQDTAEGFGQPIRNIFGPFFRIERHLPSPFDIRPTYRIVVSDHFWGWLYKPIIYSVESVSKQVGRLQRGRISIYLLYSFLTLLFMLFLVK